MCPLYLCLFSSLFFCLLFCYSVLLFCYSVLFFCYSVFIFYPSVFVLLLLCLYFLSFCLYSFVTLSLFSVLLSLFFCYSVFIFCPSVLFFCYSVFIFCPSVFVLLLLCLYFLSICLCSFVTLSLFSVLLSLFFCYSVFIFCPSVFVFPASKQKKDHRIFKEGSSISGDHLDIVKQELWATVLHRHLLQVFVHRAGAAVDRVVVLGIPAHGIC